MTMLPPRSNKYRYSWLASAGNLASEFLGLFKMRHARRVQEPKEASLPWLKSYPPQVDWAAELPVKPLFALLDDAAALHGGRTCIEFRGRRYSYAEVKALSDKAAKGLVEAGFKPGMKLGLFLPNCPYFVAFYFACLKAGGTIVNFNPLYAEEEIARQIEDSGTDFMVTLDLALLLNKFSGMFERTKLKRVIVCSLAEQLSTVKGLLFRAVKWRDIAARPRHEHYIPGRQILHNDGRFEPVEIDPKKSVAVLQYTGGTTGTPKAAILTHANIYVNAMQCKRWFYVADSPDSVSVGVLPLFHALAMTSVMNWSLAVGGSILLEPRFEAAKLLALIHSRKPTAMVGVPTIFTALMNEPDFSKYDLSSLKFCISGGASLPLKVQEDFKVRTGVAIWEGYGLSEASPVCCINPVHVPNRSGSVGLPIPQTICEIVSIDDRHKLLKIGETGEICFRGPQVMQGYWNNPEATADVLLDGRLHTGDIGHIDADGYVYVTDRLKEMITVSGFKVYPRQVEEVLYRHAAIKDCAVFGIDDERRGQSVHAAIALREGEKLSAGEINEFLKSRLSHMEIPKSYDFRPELPKTAIGKIYKKILIEEHKMKSAASQEKSS